jgi:hypothetical protein
MRLRSSTLVLVALTLTACTRGVGDVIELPTAPSPPAARPVKLTITPLGGGTLLAGDSAPLTTSGALPGSGAVLGAFAEFDNGQGRYVEAAWTSSDVNVIAIVDNRFIARAPGAVTITATFEGHSDTEQFTAGPGIFGRWSGAYVVERCVANTGSMDDVLCRTPSGGRSGIAPVGATLPFAMEITAVSGDQISGRVFFGMLIGTLTGTNRGGGTFALEGVIAGPGGTITIVGWNMRAVSDAMEGVLGYEMRLDGVAGIGGVAGRLATMTRQD